MPSNRPTATLLSEAKSLLGPKHFRRLGVEEHLAEKKQKIDALILEIQTKNPPVPKALSEKLLKLQTMSKQLDEAIKKQKKEDPNNLKDIEDFGKETEQKATKEELIRDAQDALKKNWGKTSLEDKQRKKENITILINQIDTQLKTKSNNNTLEQFEPVLQEEKQSISLKQLTELKEKLKKEKQVLEGKILKEKRKNQKKEKKQRQEEENKKREKEEKEQREKNQEKEEEVKKKKQEEAFTQKIDTFREDIKPYLITDQDNFSLPPVEHEDDDTPSLDETFKKVNTLIWFNDIRNEIPSSAITRITYGLRTKTDITTKLKTLDELELRLILHRTKIAQSVQSTLDETEQPDSTLIAKVDKYFKQLGKIDAGLKAIAELKTTLLGLTPEQDLVTLLGDEVQSHPDLSTAEETVWNYLGTSSENNSGDPLLVLAKGEDGKSIPVNKEKIDTICTTIPGKDNKKEIPLGAIFIKSDTTCKMTIYTTLEGEKLLHNNKKSSGFSIFKNSKNASPDFVVAENAAKLLLSFLNDPSTASKESAIRLKGDNDLVKMLALLCKRFGILYTGYTITPEAMKNFSNKFSDDPKHPYSKLNTIPAYVSLCHIFNTKDVEELFASKQHG